MAKAKHPWDGLSAADQQRLFQWLEQVEEHGADGVALTAPTKTKAELAALQHTKSGDPSAALKKAFSRVAIDEYLETIGPRTVSYRERKTDKTATEFTAKVYRLGALGRKALESRLEEKAREVAGLTEVVADFGARVKTLAASLEDFAATGSTLASSTRQLAQILQQATGQPTAAATGTETSGNGSGNASDTGRLKELIRQSLPADGELEMGDLYQRVVDAVGTSVGPGTVSDAVLELADAGELDLRRWTGSIHEIPAPRCAILRGGGRVLYHVRRAESV